MSSSAVGAGRRVGWLWLAALLVVLAVLAGACANEAGNRAQPEQQPSAVDCAQLWTTVRETAVASGVDDGEARRLADQARLECEIANETIPPEAEIDEFLCADDVSLQDARPTTDDPKMVGVYFSCGADSATLGTPGQPVYLAMREIPAELTDTVDERLEGAVRAYISGPTPQEQDRGYFSAAPASLASAFQEVRIDGSAAVIDFSPKFVGQRGILQRARPPTSSLSNSAPRCSSSTALTS